MSTISTALKRLGAKKMGWWLNKEFVIATDKGVRKVNMLVAEDRAAVRDAYRYFEQKLRNRPPRRRR